METLFIQTKTELKTFLLNTQTSSKLIDKVVNDLLDLSDRYFITLLDLSVTGLPLNPPLPIAFNLF